MSEQRNSIQGVVFSNSSDAREYGKGGIWYSWINERRQFPEDVKSVFIVMPIDWEEPDIKQNGIVAEWTISEKNINGAQWKLFGDEKSPTMSPSLHWVGMWHGWLENGYLRSC